MKKVKKEILASLTSSLPWRQVFSTSSWCQDVLSVKLSLSSRKSRQDVANAHSSCATFNSKPK